MAQPAPFAGSSTFLQPRKPMRSEAAERADFSGIRYAQCWEDADILLAALEPGPGKRCLSIASAGDNTLALLSRNPENVLAIDLSPAQIACLELRVAAYRELQHGELLALIGSVESDTRPRLYQTCRKHLSTDALAFWDERPHLIAAGIGSVGKFEHYFTLFRERMLSLVHPKDRVQELLRPKLIAERRLFYDEKWNNLRWRLMFRIFFSRKVMGLLDRDPEFFRYVEGSVSERIVKRTEYALTELDPAANPYIQWILTGRHNAALPMALREENFEPIRRNLDRLKWRCGALEESLKGDQKFDCFNLSDIFEYMSPSSYEELLRMLASSACPGARLAYWNMLAPRHRPESMSAILRPLTKLSTQLFARDQAFFYSAFVVEEVVKGAA
jgi:S-adenosylmethionine-diacylglycerol 3-amino-3-carboxypropyl transferase